MQAPAEGRWHGRPVLAFLLRVVIVLGPVAASVGVAAWLTRLVPQPVGVLGQVGRVFAVLAASTVALLALERLCRRLLPLAALFELGLLFPGRAPSRFGVAHSAGRVRHLQAELDRMADLGTDPARAARQILVLVGALKTHDRRTRGHSERVRVFTDWIAAELRLPPDARDRLRWAAILHDIGKLTVPSGILNKPGQPTDEEWALLRGHPAAGARIAAPLLPWLGDAADVIVQHHERFDGAGYPNGLRGEQISLGARIVTVADVLDVMTAARSYKRPMSRAAAYRELIRCSGSQFDPLVVRAVISATTPRLRRLVGPLSWLGQLPVIGFGSLGPVSALARALGAGLIGIGGATVAPGAALASAPPTPSAARHADHPGIDAGRSADNRTRTAPAGVAHHPTNSRPGEPAASSSPRPTPVGTTPPSPPASPSPSANPPPLPSVTVPPLPSASVPPLPSVSVPPLPDPSISLP